MQESGKYLFSNYESILNQALSCRDDEMVKFELGTNKSIIELKNWLLERIGTLETKLDKIYD